MKIYFLIGLLLYSESMVAMPQDQELVTYMAARQLTHTPPPLQRQEYIVPIPAFTNTEYQASSYLPIYHVQERRLQREDEKLFCKYAVGIVLFTFVWAVTLGFAVGTNMCHK